MTPKLPLPRGWKRRGRSSVLHILALSHYTCTVAINVLNSMKNLSIRGRPKSVV